MLHYFMDAQQFCLKENQLEHQMQEFFGELISEHKVKSLFTAPTAIRAIKKEDPDGKFLKNMIYQNLILCF